MKILRLITSFREGASLSFQLGNAIVEKLEKEYPVSKVFTKNLVKNQIPHFTGVHFTSFITSSENLTPELKEAIRYSDEAIEELQAADIIVIDVPMYNFTIPSSLKAWIDQIVRAGVTFRYTENGVEGLVKGKKVYLSIATGGIYSEGPMKDFDLTERYLRNILGFIGVTDIIVFRVEGVMVSEFKDNALSTAVESVKQFNF